MPTARITSYTAHIGRLGELGTEKLIVCTHAYTDGASEVAGSSELWFADRFASAGGFTTTGSVSSVRAFLPASEYVHFLDLLRHEDPVYLHWSPTEDEQDPDGFVHLSTGPEPPGEGPIDLSP
ncbi:MAG: hypothetical protein KDB21_13490 [Acidimicrobiales bacterium]|nr:hypothetical protein [Acidimicrobiales bacterium]